MITPPPSPGHPHAPPEGTLYQVIEGGRVVDIFETEDLSDPEFLNNLKNL